LIRRSQLVALGLGDRAIENRLRAGSTRRDLERAVDEAAYLGYELSSVQPLPGRRGAGLLAAVLAEHTAGTTRTKSDFEELLFALCRRHGLPQPLVNEVVEGYEADFVWPGARVIVETDGWSAHRRRTNFERDRLRDAVAAQLATLIGVEPRA
jgi:hypothetical protein